MLLVARASALEPAGQELRLGTEGGPETVVLSDALFKQISPVDTPTGLLAVVPIPKSRVTPASSEGFTVFIDGVQNPGNLGAILRSAAAAGGTAALLSSHCADPWSPRCLRGGMGGHFRIRLEERVDLVQAAAAFKGRFVAADAHGDRSLFEADLGGEVGFVVGGEGQGISTTLLRLADQRIRIPMAAGIESLNAAAVATLLFYEWHRRQAAPSDKCVEPEAVADANPFQ